MENNPQNIDLYFVHFGDGFHGTTQFLEYNYDKGLQIAQDLENVQIIGYLPIKKRFTKIDHAEILQNYITIF